MSAPAAPSSLSHLDDRIRSIAVAPLPAGNPADVKASILLEVTIHARAKELWQVMTRPRELRRWFSPVSGHTRRGGTFYVGDSSWGTVLSVVPERRFASTWNFDDRSSTLAIDLTPPFEPEFEETSTLVSLTHASDLSSEAWESYGVLAVGAAWDALAYKLALYLTDPGTLRIQRAIAAWEKSEDAAAFMTESVQRWTEATVEFGVDPAQARAMQANTLEIMVAGPDESPVAGGPYGPGPTVGA